MRNPEEYEFTKNLKNKYQQIFLQILTKLYLVFSRKIYWPDCFSVLVLVLLLDDSKEEEESGDSIKDL